MAKSVPGRLNIINRDEFPNFKPSPRIPYRVQRRIKSVRLKMVDHDEKYEDLRKRGLTSLITNPEIYVNNKKPLDGIFSPLYGADTTQEAPIYTCGCADPLTGGANLGRICPNCHQPVRSIEADLRTTLYIDIAPYHILTYHGYTGFCKAFGTKVVNDIINSVRRINTKGKVIKDDKPTIMDLYENYDEYKDKVGVPKKYAFMSKIPVYSARLRPLMHFGMQMTILDVNKAYMSIVKSSNNLKTAPLFKMDRGVEIQRTLNQIQNDMNFIYSQVEDQLNGKGGAFRKSLASGRIDYSARMVISLDITLMPHEVDLPYTTMMILYEEEIANYLSKLEDIPVSKAISQVEENAMIRNEKFVKIINQLLKNGHGVWALINRNPTISESSILYVQVRKINDDPTDMTMHMPPDTLPLLAADFDGDQLTDIAVKDAKFHNYFLTMCPTYAFIDRANAKFNEAMDFKKDYAALISAAWEIDTAIDNYLNNPEADSSDTLMRMGIDPFDHAGLSDNQKRCLESLAAADVRNIYRQRFFGDAGYDDIMMSK